MEDPTKPKVKQLLKGLNLSEALIHEFVEDLFNLPKTPDALSEDFAFEEADFTEEAGGEAFEGRGVAMNGLSSKKEKEENDSTKATKSTPANYVQQRVAELCTGSPLDLPQRRCEEINCLGGIENLSAASGVTVCGKLLRRVRHVVTENMRSLSFADVISKLDFEEFGTQLIQSHLSLKVDFDVSCPTLDGLVQLAIDSERVFGAKMTSGGGTLTLLHRSVVETFIRNVTEKFGNKFQFYLVFPSSGARVLNTGSKSNPKSALSNVYLNHDELLQKAIENFEATYKYMPSHGASSPGIVSVMGDLGDGHLDLSLAAALNMYTVVVGSHNGTGKINVVATCDVGSEKRRTIFPTPDAGIIRPGNINWAKLVKGVVCFFKGPVKGFDCLIHSSIPGNCCVMGRSALLMAFYSFLEQLCGDKSISAELKAHQCMLAVHEFSTCVFGMSEQIVSAKTKENFLVLTNSRTLATTLIPFEDPSVNLLLTCVETEHRERRSLFFARMEECHVLAAAVGRNSLKTLTLKDLEEIKESELFKRKKISETNIRRACHVITEIERTLKATEALKNCDYDTLGQLMVESHQSLRDNFEVVSPEMETLVMTTLEVDGVFGSKLLYGGLLNCTLTLVKRWAIDDVIQHMQTDTCQNLSFYVVNTSGACRSFPLEEYLEKFTNNQFAFEHLFPY